MGSKASALVACLLMLSVAVGTRASAQGVFVLSADNSEIDTQLNVTRDDMGFSSCGIHTTIVAKEIKGYPAEAISFTLALSVANAARVGTIAKIGVFRLGGTRRRSLKISNFWVGPASAAVPLKLASLVVSPVDSEFWVGTAAWTPGIEAVMALVEGESVQFSYASPEAKTPRVLQLATKPVSMDEFSAFGACVKGLAERGRAAIVPSNLSGVGRACWLGDDEKCFDLVVDFATPGSTPSSAKGDGAAVVRFLRSRCAESDGGAACSQLGVVFIMGAIERDYQEAAIAFERACVMNEPTGCVNLAMLIRKGKVDEVDAGVRADELSAKACRLGDKNSCGRPSRVPLPSGRQ